MIRTRLRNFVPPEPPAHDKEMCWKSEDVLQPHLLEEDKSIVDSVAGESL